MKCPNCGSNAKLIYDECDAGTGMVVLTYHCKGCERDIGVYYEAD